MQDFFFDTPLWALAGFAVVGIALFIVGNNRTDATLRNLGLSVLGVGILLVLMSWFVDTDKEKGVKHSRKLVRAVQDSDWKTFDRLVASHCTVRIPVAGTIYNTRDALRRGTQMAVEQYGLKSNSVLSTEALDTGGFVKVGITVLSEGSVGYPLTTSWEMEWQDSNDGWQLTDLLATKIANQTGESMRHNFPNVR